MSKFVVSANYRDRASEYKWLVRRIDEPIEKAVACQVVYCSGVIFGDSNKAEKGFDCNRVAFCENVQVKYPETDHDLPTKSLQITVPDTTYNSYKFDGYNICRTVPVASVEFLNLHYSGDITAYGKSVDLE